MIEQVFAAALSSNPAIQAICGTRVYPLVVPTDSPMPAITYRFVGGSSKATVDTYGTQRSRVEVSCWGNSYGDAVTLRTAVIGALSQYSQNGVFISFLQTIDDFDHEVLQYPASAEFYIFSNFSKEQ
ncbi:DUF3168 domain-containing protein [Edaphobacter modestus]|uniref:Uncharacterized protein DUF3168 n=1 Tax=Edaphobacter modestus TaxID=388466 RepID=A0A4Q7YQY5_9BACT|nr:DUF3168 domain-containing protein [Edaphobacter modestus]RZU39331.1 uncharacterized protein DUF3168 [Edaphobacter modestus]